MAVPQEILRLIERYEAQREAYQSGQYKETQIRVEFIDPFFKALGWDVANEHGYAEAYKDVIHEDALKIGGATEAPDACFRIGGVRKFFVECKKPSVNIKDDVHPAYQLRRYGWSAKLPLSILTDFHEWAVYDCRLKPNPRDTAAVGRIMYLTADQYPAKWDELTAIFSREAVLTGSFDKFVESTKGKRGTASVDDAFLEEIERWRDLLARTIALRNPALSQRELNFAVQRIIDRIIFLRICEDRGIEPYGRLMTLKNGERVYPRLCEFFQRADERYNSGIFCFTKNKTAVEPPDELTLTLKIDDKTIQDIVGNLYYPESPYEFSVLSSDILGQVYERFLGKVIRLTAGHQAKVEEKPEVRKAGGVYYTPTFIVDYIVKNTVGKLLEGKTPKQAAKLKILDPACGSGSFLIGAYQYLLDWHRDWYVKQIVDAASSRVPKRQDAASTNLKLPIYQVAGGDYRLTTEERKRILLNNIFGVDIDSQAVEVTKLSLLLKVLEGESQETITKQFELFNQRALPDLGSNIKCGNSLIGPDFYQQQEMALFNEEERLRINVFNWQTEFPEIFTVDAASSRVPKRQDAASTLGFDAVIGNPPYGATLSDAESAYMRDKFETTTKDLDTYTLFMEKAIALIKPNGRFSMIVPTGWYSGPKFSALRRFIASRTDPDLFVNLPYDVFKAWVDTTVFAVVKRTRPTFWPRKDKHPVTIITFPKRHRIASPKEFEEHGSKAEFSAWFTGSEDAYLSYADAVSTAIIHKIVAAGKPLEEMADVQRGVTPFNLSEKPTHLTSRPAFNGTVRRYLFNQGDKCFIRFDDTLAEPKPERYFLGPRLLLRELISRQFQLQAVKVSIDFVTNKSMQSILLLPNGPNLNYLLGIINSHLISWFFLHRSNIAQRDDFPKIVLKETRCLPIPSVNLSNPADKAHHDQMVALVEQMLALHKQLAAAKTPQEQTALSRQITATDAQIDALVYDLYGLTAEEIKIVEG